MVTSATSRSKATVSTRRDDQLEPFAKQTMMSTTSTRIMKRL
jgi:hypothetical protein